MVNVIALGNILRGDDGIGPLVLKRLQAHPAAKEMNLVDAGSDAFLILEYLNGTNANIVVDCANMGLSPGSVRRFRMDSNILSEVDAMISLHGFSFAEIYKMADNLGPIAPVTLIGIQPETLEFGQKLSPMVERAIPQILDLIIKEAQYYAKENFDH